MTYEMEFDIAPALYRRAITQPVPALEVSPLKRNLRNVGAAILFPLSLFAFNAALFQPDTWLVMLTGGVIGASIVLAAWWVRHRSLVRMHDRCNAGGGTQRVSIDATQIDVSRQHIRSIVGWPFVTGIRGIDGATLIELPTARLIVPDTALPERATPETFRADLTKWCAA